jgi:hypothetical protein
VATSYRDQWVLQRSSERIRVVRRLFRYGAVTEAQDERSDRALRARSRLSDRQSGESGSAQQGCEKQTLSEPKSKASYWGIARQSAGGD